MKILANKKLRSDIVKIIDDLEIPYNVEVDLYYLYDEIFRYCKETGTRPSGNIYELRQTGMNRFFLFINQEYWCEVGYLLSNRQSYGNDEESLYWESQILNRQSKGEYE